MVRKVRSQVNKDDVLIIVRRCDGAMMRVKSDMASKVATLPHTQTRREVKYILCRRRRDVGEKERSDLNKKGR